jgi:hypothetical protein
MEPMYVLVLGALFALAFFAVVVTYLERLDRAERRRAALLIRQEAGQIRDYLLRRFDEFDTKCDGKLSDQELAAVQHRLVGQERAWVEAVCQHLNVLGHRTGERTFVVPDGMGGAHAVVMASYAVSREDLLQLEERIEARENA